MRNCTVRTFLLSALLLTASLAAARTILKPGFNLFSKQQEIELGKQASTEVEKQVTVVNDPVLTNYVSGLGRKLSHYAPNSDYPFTFKVVKDKNINAFALPGGPIYVNSGTIVVADNESQLAGVLAHEIGHVAMRHGTNNASKAQAAQLPLSVLGGMLGTGAGGQLAALVASFGVNSLFLKYSRDAERQADIVGAQILYDAGYNPEQMARFFQKLEEEQKTRPLEFLSDHPNPGNRVLLVRNEAQTMGPPKGRGAEGNQFAPMRTLAVNWNNRPDPPKKPAIEPSKTLSSYNGRGFRISHPDNWQVSSQDSPVTIAPKEGVTKEGLAYGALINVFNPQDSAQGHVTISEATNQLVEQLRQGNPGIRMNGTAQRITVAGASGESVTLTGHSPIRGESETDWLVTALRPDGSLWYVVFVSTEKDFPSMRPTFTRMLETVQLTN